MDTIDGAEVMSAFKAFSYGAPRGHVRIDVLERALCSYGEDKMTKKQAKNFVQQVI